MIKINKYGTSNKYVNILHVNIYSNRSICDMKCKSLPYSRDTVSQPNALWIIGNDR